MGRIEMQEREVKEYPNIKITRSFEGSCESCKEPFTDHVVSITKTTISINNTLSMPSVKEDNTVKTLVCSGCWVEVFKFMQRARLDGSNDSR